MPENHKKITYATVCSGIECMSAAVGPLGGWEPVFFSEIEPFPCAVLQHHYPTVPNLGDMTKIKAEQTGADSWRVTNGETTIDLDQRLGVFAGGTPCFVAGTMVLTENGYRAIETLKVGDKVVTHQGRLRRVLRIGSKEAETAEVRVASRPPMRCTLDHKFWSATKMHHTHDCHLAIDECGFVEVGQNVRGYVAQQRKYDIPMPTFPVVGQCSDEQVAELAGWYCGDGYIRSFRGSEKKAVVLTLKDAKLSTLIERLGENVHISQGNPDRNGVFKAHIYSTELAQWLVGNFEKLAVGKTVPAWLIAAPPNIREAFIRGYLATDGCTLPNGSVSFTTVSESLALGVADVLRNACVFYNKVPPRCVIEGREVNQRPFYIVRKNLRQNRFHDFGDWSFVKVKSLEGMRRETVYQIEVEEDHSYVSAGIVSKNCQDISIAGKRAGMAEGSGTRSSLAFHFARLVGELKPRWVLWENVPNALGKGIAPDFLRFAWQIAEHGYHLAYRVLDAQWTRVDGLPRAVPQRRRRVWLVGHLGDDWEPSCEVLLEREGLLGDSPPRRITGKGFAGTPGGGAQGADRPVATSSNGADVMPALTSTDLVKRMTGEADRGGGYVMQPSGFDPYEPGGVKSATDEVSGTIVNGSSPGFHNAVCFENHQAGCHKHTVADVAPTMGATHNAQAANNNPLVVSPADVFGKVGHAIDKAGTGEKYKKIDVAETRNTFANSEVRAQEVVVAPVDGVVAIDMDKNKPTNADKPVRKGGAGFGVSEKGASYTLTARDQHAVAYAIDSMGSNAMKSKNPHSGCREVECAPTLTTVDSAPVKHQGGMAVVAFLPGNSGKARSIAADEEVSPTLMRTQGESGNKVAVAAECVGVFDMAAGKSGARTDTSGVSPTILALHGTDPHAVCIGFDAQMGKMNTSPKENLSETLAVAHQCGVAIGFNAECGTHDDKPKDELSGTLAASHKAGVAIGLDRASYNQSDKAKFAPDIREECSPTMISRGPCAVSFEPGIAKREGAAHRFSDEVTSTLRSDMGDNLPAVATGDAVDYIVRRLTPLECERLQGLPDGYTLIPHRGKPASECPDTPRYRALGNAWAVNCARWICQRIQNYDKAHEQENTHGNE